MAGYQKREPFRLFRALLHRLLVVVGAAAMTLALFLVLPLMQTLARPPSVDLVVSTVDTARLEPPPPPPPEEKKEEPPPEEAPPELKDETVPLSLDRIEIALNPGMGGGLPGPDLAVNLHAGVAGRAMDAIFSLSDLDQKPRVTYQPGPAMNAAMRKKAPGTVYVVFLVNEEGRVENPMVEKSSDPVFEEPAVNAVRKWRFEPGKRAGKAVRFRMRVPITFPRG